MERRTDMVGRSAMKMMVSMIVIALAGCAAAPAPAPALAPVPTSVVRAIQPAAGSPPTIGRETVNATLWMQRAAEYRISTEQVYRLATERLATSIAAPGTAVGNAARRALAGGEFDEPSWDAWMAEGAATAVPGAIEFLQAASRAGHRIF